MNRRRFLATLIAAPVAAAAALRAPIVIPARTMFASIHFTPAQMALLLDRRPRVMMLSNPVGPDWIRRQYFIAGDQWPR
jgi:hypothetical protein